MKKLLLATSALVGAGALVATASAGAPTLSIGGNLDFRLVGGQVQARGAGTAVEANGDTVDVGSAQNGFDLTRANSRSEIKFRANGESDGGTKYGAVIDYRYLQTGDGQKTDESYIYVAGDWGRVHLGDDDGAMDHRIPNAGWIAPGAYLIDDTTTYIDMEANSDIDDTKITYFTPNMGGFEAAFSVYEAVGTFKNADDEDTDRYEDVIEAAISYSGSSGDVSYNVGLGIQSGSLTTAGASDLNKSIVPVEGEARTIAADDLSEFGIGGTLSFGAISLAFGYNSEGDTGTVQVAAGELTNSALNVTALNGVKSAGREVSTLGIAYNLGDGMSVGLSVGEATTGYYRTLTAYNADGDQITIANTDPATVAANPRVGAAGNSVEIEDTQSLVAIDFGFPILEGMSGYAGIAFSEWERASVTQATANGLNLASVTGGQVDGSASTAAADYRYVGRTAEATTYVIGTTVSF